MSILHLNTTSYSKFITHFSTFLYASIALVGIYSGFSFVVFFSTQPASNVSFKNHIQRRQIANASELLPPAITISEIMSCPLTGGKEWIELARNKESLANQFPFSEEFFLTSYRLDDDKSTIWTGNTSTPVSFNQNQELAQIELSKQYLNNTGDSLKLWSPTGELLDEAIIPACKESGLSWSFQDGEWVGGKPSPGEPNPTIPIPTPISTPTPSPTPTPSALPTPIPNPTGTPQPTQSPIATQQTAQTKSATETTVNIQNSSSIDPAYVQRIFLTTDRNENQTTTKSATLADSYSKEGSILGINSQTGEKSESNQDIQEKPLTDTNATKSLQPTIHHSPLPERSPSSYISAILGGVLLTTSGGIHSIYTQHSNGKQKKQTQNTT